MKAKDLAKKLGVSPATISLVLNNKPGISDSLRHSLLDKIRELGCGDMMCEGCGGTAVLPEQPDPIRGRLRPVVVYLIYTSCDEYDDRFAFYPAVLEGAEMEARDNSYNLVVLHMNCEGNANLRNLIECSGEAIGAIVQTNTITPCILNDVRCLDIPYVFVDAYRPDQRVSSVCVNNEQGVFRAVDYLKSKGHRELGYVYSGSESDSMVERRRCFHQALREYGLEDNRNHYFLAGGGESIDVLEQLCSEIRQRDKMPTALLAENDRLAWQAIKALERSGLRVPDDVSIIGFDDRTICTMVEPKLTSIKNYRHLMGRECVMMLQNIRRMQKLGLKDPCLKYELPTELIERDSVRDLTVK